jgi:hypothetical protein
MSLKMMMTDPDLEKNGVWVVYNEETRILLARAGNFNTAYTRVLNAKTKPHKRAIDNELLSETKGRRILQEVYIETVIKRWETLQYGRWVRGIDGSFKGVNEVLPETAENMIAAFEAVPDLWLCIVKDANLMVNYRREELEEEAKNS